MSENDDKIAELLIEWEESWEQGVEIPAEDLCRHNPELLEIIQQKVSALKEMAWVKEDAEYSDAQNVPKILANRYELRDQIAVGGFGQVWKGFDTELERYVAIKFPKNLDRDLSDDLLEEARKVARLKHLGIVTVYDVGRQDGFIFIVSDLIEGTDLAHKLKQEQFELTEAIQLVIQAAENLHFAHEQGFVHRDVKPANILIDHSEKVFIADFGIAITKGELEGLSESVGTLAYMSPEQLAGESQLIDARTDIYALGVILFELLTGTHPFPSKTSLELREHILFSDPPSLRHLNSAIPIELERICLKCLRKHPDDRYQSGKELASDLNAAMNSLPYRKLRPFVFGGLSIAVISLIAVWGMENFTISQKPSERLLAEPPPINLVRNNVLHFDGKTRIVTPVKQFLPVTIEAWVRTQDKHMMFLVGSDIPDRFGIGMNLVGLAPSVEIVKGGFTAPKVVNGNRWFHMAGVFGKRGTTLFIDGKPVAKGPASQISGDTSFVIGNLGVDHLSQFFNGQIRSVRITEGERYDESFTPDEVLTTDDETVLLYDSTSFKDNQVIDLSDRNNDGTIERLTVQSFPPIENTNNKK